MDVLDGLDALVQQSLLRQEAGPGGEARFAMLETIREYGLELLDAMPDEEAVRRAHAKYFLTLAEEAEQHLSGPEQATWLDRLGADHDNLRAALGWMEHAKDQGSHLRLGVALWRFWWLRGHLTEGRSLLDRALANAEGAPTTVQAEARRGAGILAESQGDFERATTLHEEALALMRQVRGSVWSRHLAHRPRDHRAVPRRIRACHRATRGGPLPLATAWRRGGDDQLTL